MAIIGESRAAAALLILRLSLGVFLLQWSLEKIVAPEGAIQVAQHFYGLALTGRTVFILGLAEALLAIALLIGRWRGWSYVLAVLIHAFSVASTWQQLLNPYGPGANHLFIAGVPVLAAFIVLYMLREWDAYSVDDWRKR